MILLNGGKKKGLRISQRVESSQVAKNKPPPMTPSQFDIPARNRCHGRLVVSGFDESTETRSKASCSCFAVSGSSKLVASECIHRDCNCQAAPGASLTTHNASFLRNRNPRRCRLQNARWRGLYAILRRKRISKTM